MARTVPFALAAFGLRGVTSLGPNGCEYAHGFDEAPFVFHNRSQDGTRTEVPAQLDPETGLCVFPGASCSLHSVGSCCTQSKVVDEGASQGKMLNAILCPAVLFTPMYALLVAQRCKARRKAAAEADGKGAAPAGRREDFGARMRKALPHLAFWAALSVSVTAMVVVANVTQRKLTVPTRNSLLAADAFLTPIKDVFQFLEDVVLVKINLAMGAMALKEVRHVLKLGILGGAMLGALAALVLTGLCFWPSAIEFLLAPFASKASGLACSLIPPAADVVALSRPYVLLTAWGWPFDFVNMALRGFLLGANEFTGYAVMCLAEGVICLAIFVLWFIPHPEVKVLGWMKFISSVSATFFMAGMIMFNRPLRERYGFTAPTPTPAAPEERLEGGHPEVSSEDTSDDSLPPEACSKRQTVIEGLSAMLLEISVQLGLSIGVYTAGAQMGMGPMYQISTLQAAFPQYGIQYIVAIGMIWKMKGAQILARREYGQFLFWFKVLCCFATALAVCAFGTLLPFRTPLSFHMAENACEYASQPGCLPVYMSIFGGGNAPDSLTTIQGSAFMAFLPALVAVCYFRLFRSCLYVTNDWSFMAKAGAASFLLVFVPAILVAVLALDNTTAVFVAIYLPFLVLGIAFALRTWWNIRGMFSGRPGPWETTAAPPLAKLQPPLPEQEEVVASASGGAPRSTATTEAPAEPPRQEGAEAMTAPTSEEAQRRTATAETPAEPPRQEADEAVPSTSGETPRSTAMEETAAEPPRQDADEVAAAA